MGQTQKEHPFGMGAWGSQGIGRGGCDRGLLGHACACARVLVCMLGCLSSLVAVGFLEEKTFPLAVVRARGSSLSLLPTSPPLSPCPAASRLREKHCIQTEGSGNFSAESRQQGFGEKSTSVAGLVPSLSPFLVHHALAAASWALTERQGCGACGGWRLLELELPAALLSHWGTLVPKVFPISGTFCTQT